MGRLPLWLDDTPALTLLDLRAKIRRLQAEISRGADNGMPAKKLGLVVIDYLQLMQGRKDAGSREQEISELSRGLKAMAKEMGVAVIALSHSCPICASPAPSSRTPTPSSSSTATSTISATARTKAWLS
jgi:replicative DNA helicase